MIRKLLSRGFAKKAIIAFLILVQFVLLLVLFLWLSGFSGLNPAWVIIIVAALCAASDVAGFYILNSTSSDAYRLSWMLVVFVLPGIGLFLYLFFANKQNTRRVRDGTRKMVLPVIEQDWEQEEKEGLRKFSDSCYNISCFLYNVDKIIPYRHCSVEYFPLADFVLDPLLRELSKAKHYIFIEFFIIEEKGVFFSSMLEILRKKAADGVDVRIIYDDVGSLTTVDDSFPERMERLGIKVTPFNRFRPLFDVRQNNRNHRKILIVDGHTAFTGGFNIADEYLNKKERFGHWKDNAILVRGEAVTAYTLTFLSDWLLSHPGEVIDKASYHSSAHIDEIGGYPEEEGYVEPYADLPYDGEPVGERVYLSIIERATKYVYIATPYLIMDSEMENALCFAAKSGVDVRVLTPHIPDKKAVFGLTRSNYKKLLLSGAKVYEYTPGFVHEKMFVSDDAIATVGTINLDYRSLYLHFENGTLLYAHPAIKNMKRDYLDTIAVSKQVSAEDYARWERKNKYYWGLLKAIAPFL